MTMEDVVKRLRNVADWHYGKYEQTHEEDYLNDGDFFDGCCEHAERTGGFAESTGDEGDDP